MEKTRAVGFPAGLREAGPDVYYTDAPLVVAGPDELAFLRERARTSPRLRARICTHGDPGDPVHEMLIVHHRTTYVRPHRHREKSESLHVIEGEALVAFFDDAGNVRDSVELGESRSQKPFYYRIPAGWWHMLLIRSEWLIFAEVVAGPFERAQTEFPAWAPSGDDEAAAQVYRESIAMKARR